MTDEEIDNVMRTSPDVKTPVEPELLKHIAATISASLRPVRPLPPTWVLAAGLVLICAMVAVAAGASIGFYGIAKMLLWVRVLIFSTLGFLTWIAGREFVGQMIPGSRQYLTVGAFLTAGTVVLLLVFALAFHDYQTEHFVSAGIPCLRTGVLFALPTALLSWLLLRRGFAVNPAVAGLAVGALAGLGGVAMLELHCANFQAMHVLVWHTAVLPVSAAGGALLGWALRELRQ